MRGLYPIHSKSHEILHPKKKPRVNNLFYCPTGWGTMMKTPSLSVRLTQKIPTKLFTRNSPSLPTSSSHSALKYRPEIDGLRAVALLPVIFFHAGFELFSGGFVGVDVFFVVSGYLITSILLSQMDNGRFNLLHFYERRARRILPALFAVILVCIPFAWL